MLYRPIIIIALVLALLAQPYSASASFSMFKPLFWPENKVLSNVTYSLENRHKNAYVNEVFSDNILLTLAYMDGDVKNANDIAWNKIRSQNQTQITLAPGQTFAFHDTTFAKYEDQIALTTNAHFNFSQGFRSSGYLVGDGVCHLASFIRVAAQEAGLNVEAPVRHDFAAIPEVDKVDGVSIYYTPFDANNSSRQNLYITNNQNKTIAFVFNHNTSSLNIQVQELN